MLRRPEARGRLLEAAGACDRLVLLGDLLELRHGPERDALAAARELLIELGGALGPEREVVILAGNHDHHLLDAWNERRSRVASAPALGLQAAVDWEPGETLATLAAWLAPARVSAAYPGVWLRSDVYAIHGHYADLHLTIPTLERLAAGVMSRIVHIPADGPLRAEDYESALAPIYAWIHALAQRIDPALGGSLHGGSVRGWDALTGARRQGSRRPGLSRCALRHVRPGRTGLGRVAPARAGLQRAALAAAFAVMVAGLNRAGIGPLAPELSGAALRRAGLRGVEHAAARLGAAAPHLIFGHTHRAGPLPGDDPAEWRTRAGAQLINCGCWVTEPSFLGPEPRASPYRVGFCVLVDDHGPPRLVNLLD